MINQEVLKEGIARAHQAIQCITKAEAEGTYKDCVQSNFGQNTINNLNDFIEHAEEVLSLARIK